MSTTILTRRQFLATAAVAALAPAVHAADKPLLVDTHVHCFAGPADKRFPYHPRGPYHPDDIATPEQLIKCMDDGGVDHAIIVHPEPYQDDHRYLEYCMGVGGKRLKGTVLLFCDRPGSLEQLPALVKRMPIVAVRVHAYAPERLPPFDGPELRRLWKAAADNGVAVQLHLEARWAPHFTPLIKEFKDVRVIIDHCGRPMQCTPEEFSVVVGWSRFDNTVMKLSATQPVTVFPHRDIRPFIRQLTDAFGPDRMICGGGFGPAATGPSYAAAFELARRYVDHLSATDQAKILGQTAAKLFGFTA